MIQLLHGDCLQILPTLKAESVDLVLADPPYGATACAWDSVIDLNSMWHELKRVIKPNGAIALFGSQPFTSVLIASNLRDFKYSWVWEKSFGTGFLNAKKMPLRVHEDIAVFYRKTPTYNPQMAVVTPKTVTRRTDGVSTVYGDYKRSTSSNGGQAYPRDVLYFAKSNVAGTFHPTQKPVPLLRYLIRTYTHPKDTVLDFCMGSGSTGVGCEEEQRAFIGIEQDKTYFDIAVNRIQEAQKSPSTAPMELLSI